MGRSGGRLRITVLHGVCSTSQAFRMALRALIIKARLVLIDEELVAQIKESPNLQFFIDLEAFQYSASFDPSMIVNFRKRLPETVVKDCNERIVRHGLTMIRSAGSQNDDAEDQASAPANSGNQQAPASKESTKGFSVD